MRSCEAMLLHVVYTVVAICVLTASVTKHGTSKRLLFPYFSRKMHSINADIAWDIAFLLDVTDISSFMCLSKELNELLTSITSNHSRLWIEKLKHRSTSPQIKNNFNSVKDAILNHTLVLYDKHGTLQKVSSKARSPIDWKTRFVIFNAVMESDVSGFIPKEYSDRFTYTDLLLYRIQRPDPYSDYLVVCYLIDDPQLLRESLFSYEVVLKGALLHSLVSKLFDVGTPEKLSMMLERWIGEGKSNLNHIAKRLVTEQKDTLNWIMSMILPHIDISTLKHCLTTAKELNLTKITEAILTHPKLPNNLKQKPKSKVTKVPIIGVKGKRVLY